MQIVEAAKAEEDRLHETQCLHAVQILEQMTEALISNYMPGITQIICVIDGMSIEDALTKGGTITPCVTNVVTTVIQNPAFG